MVKDVVRIDNGVKIIRKPVPKQVKQLKQKTEVRPILNEEHRTGYRVMPTGKRETIKHSPSERTLYAHSALRECADVRPITVGHYVDDLGLIHVFTSEIKSIQSLKSQHEKTDFTPSTGQYTRLSASCRQFKYVIDRYQPTIIYKASLVDAGAPLEAIWVKRNGEWQATRILTSEEYNSFVVFAGSCVIDLDKLIREKSSKLKVEGKRNNPTRFTGKAVELEKFEQGAKSQTNRKKLIQSVKFG